MTITAADIPKINSIAGVLSSDIAAFQRFADQLKTLADANFIIPVADGVETVTLTAIQKNNLLAQYQTLKGQMAADFAQLP